MVGGSMDVRVENQLVRFVCPTPINHDRVVAELKNSVISHGTLRATLVIDEEGRIAVHEPID